MQPKAKAVGADWRSASPEGETHPKDGTKFRNRRLSHRCIRIILNSAMFQSEQLRLRRLDPNSSKALTTTFN